jgi:phospholipase/carboxylesterase
MSALQYVLRTPTGADDSAEIPLVVVLHGRGADANDLADLAPHLDRGYRFVFPNAPKPFEPMPGYSFGFTWFDGWPADRDSVVESRTLLLQFLDEIIAKYPTPPGKVVLCGFSQGGLMALDVGFRTAIKLAGIVVMSGALYEDDLPTFRKDIPVMIVHGTADDAILPLAARRARLVLEENGVDVDYREFPIGHEVSEESMAEVAGFMARRLL